MTVEYVGLLAVPGDVAQVVVVLPNEVFGAPRNLWVKVQLRGPASNKAFIRIAG